jgi:hypothetical protein
VPTYERRPRFDRDYGRLSDEQRAAFSRAVRQLIADLRAGSGRFHPSLRVHRIDARRGVWLLSFGADLRATFSYGTPRRESDAHIVWRRAGRHGVYRKP